MRASHDSRETLARISHDSCETLERMSHDVRANFDQFYSSQISLEMVLCDNVAYLSLCADRGNFLVMCLRTSAKGWRRVCDDLAMVLL